MARKCKSAIKTFCGDLEAGSARVIDCLADNKEKVAKLRSVATLGFLNPHTTTTLQDGMEEACAAEIQKDEELTATDWRLKFGVSHQCESDIDELCKREKDEKGASGEGYRLKSRQKN